MNICLIYNNAGTGSSYYRLEMPHSFNMDGMNIFCVESPLMIEASDLEMLDLIIVNRSWCFPSSDKKVDIVHTTAKLLRTYGTKIILDMDDHWELGTGHSFYKYYQENKMTDFVREHVKVADGVITSTKYLEAECRNLNSKTITLPNVPNVSLYEQYSLKSVPKSKFGIGYFGGAQHEEDVELLRISMGKLSCDSSLDGRYLLALAGYNDNPVYNAYEKIFSNDGHNINYTRILAADIYSYVGGYNYVDVALAPLRKTKFNMFKSELKITEAAFMGKTVICSDLPMYADVVKDGYNGFIIPDNKKSLWYKRIKTLINEPDLSDLMATRLKEDMIQFLSPEEVPKKRMEFYRSICSK